MVTDAKIDGRIPTISAGIRKTIQSIKEIVGNHSDADIYVSLKETNMDPNETAQNLLNQDPFHEVKRKRSKKKENVENKGPAEPSNNQQEIVTEFNSFDQNIQSDGNYKRSERSQRGCYNLRGVYDQRGGGGFRGGDIRRGDDYQRGGSVYKIDENHKNDDFQTDDGNLRDSCFQRHDINQRDGDVQRGDGNFRGAGVQGGCSFQGGSGFYRGGGVRKVVSFQRDGYARNPLPVKAREFRVVRDNRVNQNTSQDASALYQYPICNDEEAICNGTTKGDSSERLNNQKAAGFKGSSNEKVNESKGFDERRGPFQSLNTQRQAGKTKDPRPRSAGQASNNSVLGVYSSSSDPVHVPSPARSSANGSFRREVGVVGVRKMPADNARKQTSVNATSAKGNPSADSVRPLVSPKGNQNGQNTATGPLIPVTSGRLFSNNNQYAHRSYQQPAGHQKAVQPIKEWKPKSTQKYVVSAGVARLSSESALPAAEFSSDGLKNSNIEEEKFLDNNSSRENQGVIIAEHIQVPDIERCRVTFGSFGLDAISSDSIAGSQTVGHAVEFGGGPSTSLLVSASDASNVVVAVHKSPESSASGEVVEHHYSDAKDFLGPQNLESYAEIGMVPSDNTSYGSPVLQKQYDAVPTGGFSAYDPQTGYGIAYFTHSVDEAASGGLPSAQEGFNSHAAGMIPASQALYQQQAQVTQMYPQVHVSHCMPYRQFIPPVYAPPMGMPGYSTNTAYAHSANGNGYVLMPGGSSHLNANAMKYGGAQQQFKPALGGTHTGFGNYTAPNGYSVNAPGSLMGATGIDDPSRLKFNDGNPYAQNPQGEAQEMWMQNPREITGLQSSQYYSIQGQATHGTYMPSHPGHHAAFNPATALAAQSSHMQFPGLYLPQAAAMPNLHRMTSANAALGVPQVASYQQPQMNHLQWTSNTF